MSACRFDGRRVAGRRQTSRSISICRRSRRPSRCVSDQRVNVRRLAKRLLLDAHFGAATDNAWGVWQKKANHGRSLDSASRPIGERPVDHEEADPQLRLDVAAGPVRRRGNRRQMGRLRMGQQALDTGRKLIEIRRSAPPRAFAMELGTALVDAFELQRTAGLNPNRWPMRWRC